MQMREKLATTIIEETTNKCMDLILTIIDKFVEDDIDKAVILRNIAVNILGNSIQATCNDDILDFAFKETIEHLQEWVDNAKEQIKQENKEKCKKCGDSHE